MKELLKKYEEINSKIKELTEEKEAIKAEIRLYMINNNLDKHKIDNYNIYYSKQQRNNLDKKKLKNYISDEDLEKCYNISEYTVLKVLTDDKLSQMKRFINK